MSQNKLDGRINLNIKLIGKSTFIIAYDEISLKIL